MLKKLEQEKFLGIIRKEKLLYVASHLNINYSITIGNDSNIYCKIYIPNYIMDDDCLDILEISIDNSITVGETSLDVLFKGSNIYVLTLKISSMLDGNIFAYSKKGKKTFYIDTENDNIYNSEDQNPLSEIGSFSVIAIKLIDIIVEGNLIDITKISKTNMTRVWFNEVLESRKKLKIPTRKNIMQHIRLYDRQSLVKSQSLINAISKQYKNELRKKYNDFKISDINKDEYIDIILDLCKIIGLVETYTNFIINSISDSIDFTSRINESETINFSKSISIISISQELCRSVILHNAGYGNVKLKGNGITKNFRITDMVTINKSIFNFFDNILRKILDDPDRVYIKIENNIDKKELITKVREYRDQGKNNSINGIKAISRLFVVSINYIKGSYVGKFNSDNLPLYMNRQLTTLNKLNVDYLYFLKSGGEINDNIGFSSRLIDYDNCYLN